MRPFWRRLNAGFSEPTCWTAYQALRLRFYSAFQRFVNVGSDASAAALCQSKE